MQKKYSPTSYFFDVKKWKKSLNKKELSNHEYLLSGEIIGSLLKKIDTEFQKKLNECTHLSENEVIYFQQHETIRFFKSINEGSGATLESLPAVMEAISDGCGLLLKQAKVAKLKIESVDFYRTLLQLACERIYLCEQWKKFENNRVSLLEDGSKFIFSPKNKWLDFGERLAVARYQDHLNQIQYELKKNSDTNFLTLRYLPSSILLVEGGMKFEFSTLSHSDVSQAYLIASQVPFYYKELAKLPFNDYSLIDITDIMLVWIVLSRVSVLLVKEQVTSTETIYSPFDEFFLADLISKCTGFPRTKSLQAISAISNSRANLEDFYIKPIYRASDDLFLILPCLISGQFTRVADYFVSTQILNDPLKKKKLDKGKSFEREFAGELQKQIDSNPNLKDVFCRILCIGFKQRKGRENEELDIILRIGQTYLIIEAKSFTYRTNNQGYHNNLTTFESSDINRKKRVFIEDIEIFREKFDPDADFELNPENVICCYLSSVPHCVGMKVNDTKVVDASILERYFGNGYIELIAKDNTPQLFKFYDCGLQAEKNLVRYLHELPQLYKYYDSFKYINANYRGRFNGFDVTFQEPYFDLTDYNQDKSRDKLLKMASDWKHQNAVVELFIASSK